MANELNAHTTTGLTIYAVLLNNTGQIWNGVTFVAINGVNWTDYDVSMTEAAAGIYLADMPAVALGAYSYAAYRMLSGTAMTVDTLEGTGYILWDGTTEITPVGLSTIIEGAVTFKQWVCRVAAVLFGKASGGGIAGSKKFRNLGDTLDRVDATTDANGNRTSVTFDDS